ncbi:GTP-binding protein 1 [Artemisia annua]|uniref:GTP-binding protein 1 n=1 Tax=Artemisia annua TaxID=35608 RepID=A0A2U1PMP9_ARTAN|nr:GTP-binding protein 1 [Artemisia annua]
MRVQLSQIAVDVVDAPLGPGCADRIIMRYMFEFAMNCPPPEFELGKTLLEKLKTQYSSIEGLPPDRIVPTVGLNIGRIETSNTKLVFWDLGGQLIQTSPQSLDKLYMLHQKAFGLMHSYFQSGLRSIWEKYYEEAHAVVFVVDASCPSRFEESKSALENIQHINMLPEKVLRHEDLQGAPLLILANKQDLADAVSAEELAQYLDLKKLDERAYAFEGVSGYDGWKISGLGNGSSRVTGIEIPSGTVPVHTLNTRDKNGTGSCSKRRAKASPRREAWPRRHEMDQGVRSRRRVKRRGIRREKACKGAPFCKVVNALRVQLSQIAVDVVDAPLGPGCAGRIIMRDMFEFAMNCPPPGVISLISGDADFIETSLRRLGHTVVVVSKYKESSKQEISVITTLFGLL